MRLKTRITFRYFIFILMMLAACECSAGEKKDSKKSTVQSGKVTFIKGDLGWLARPE